MSFWVAGIAAVVAIGGSIAQSEADADNRDAQIYANRASARAKYASTESSINIMKKVSRESSINAVGEALRAGAASDSKVRSKVQEVASTAASQSEGLTSGRTKGRQMISLYVKGNEALQTNQNKTTSMINQITTKQDEYTNNLNNKLFAAHQDMAAVLAGVGPTIDGTGAAISAGMSGFSSGMSIGSSIGGASASTTTQPTTSQPIDDGTLYEGGASGWY